VGDRAIQVGAAEMVADEGATVVAREVDHCTMAPAYSYSQPT